MTAAVPPPPDLLGLARAGLAHDATPEAMLWDELDLDDPDERHFGDYELLERIGRGGMGVVFRARQLSLGREVALKFIVGNLADHAPAVERFVDEARAAARLHHPHIVPVIEAGSVEGMHYFTMPLLRGGTLARQVAAARFPPPQAVDLLLKLAGAMAYAHEFGLLHLDLKPANVLFDEHAQPRIGDFGLARHADATGGVDARESSGTPGYMAPEQAGVGSHRLSASTDIHALGAILYEVLTGTPPRDPADAPDRPEEAAAGRIVPPRQRDSSIPRDLEAICLKCLHPVPRHRYGSAADLAADLARFRDGNAVHARDSHWHERLARNLRRHPALTAASALALVAMMLGLAATGWQWQRAERARAEADRQRSLAQAQAERMRQLAGLMAAAFPAGDAARDERTNSARAAVAWLKRHLAEDPAAQRALLASFRDALDDARRQDAVAVLVSEITDQLGDDYRAQQVERLARLGDRDSLIAAALIGIPSDTDTESGASHARILQRLFDAHPRDATALHAAALACHVQPTCMQPAYHTRLVDAFPDNAVHWVLLPGGAQPSDRDLASVLQHAAAARTFDDRLSTWATLVREALRDQSPPDSIGQPMQAVVSASEVSPSLRRNAFNGVPMPVYGAIVRLCKPDNEAMGNIAGLRDDCGAFARKGMRSAQASILTRMVGSAMARRLYKGTSVATEALEYRRQYVWLGEHAGATSTDVERLQREVAQYGEWEALQRQAERTGTPRSPPAGWKPADAEALLLPEERAAAVPGG